MADSDVYSTPDESLRRLYRLGWRMGELAFFDGARRSVLRVYGGNGENQIRVEGATTDEAWRRAVETAAACGMLAD